MITLHDYLPSQNAWKVRLLLVHLDRPYRSEMVSIFAGEGQRPDFLALNPMGAAPVLQLEDGRAIWESNAILTYLAEGTAYLPTDPFVRATVMQWLCFEAGEINPTIATLRHWTLTGKLGRRTGVEAKRDAGAKALRVMEGELERQAFFAGDAYTIADMALYAYVHRAEEAGYKLADYPRISAWIERVRLQPGFLDTIYPYSIDPLSVRDLP
jgi:glutathione S-transferase